MRDRPQDYCSWMICRGRRLKSASPLPYCMARSKLPTHQPSEWRRGSEPFCTITYLSHLSPPPTEKHRLSRCWYGGQRRNVNVYATLHCTILTNGLIFWSSNLRLINRYRYSRYLANKNILCTQLVFFECCGLCFTGWNLKHFNWDGWTYF
jgi:hypothetical protein